MDNVIKPVLQYLNNNQTLGTLQIDDPWEVLTSKLLPSTVFRQGERIGNDSFDKIKKIDRF